MTKLDGIMRAARGAAGVCWCAVLSGCGAGAPPPGQEPSDLPALNALFGRDSVDRGAPLRADERDEVLSILRVQGVDVTQARFSADDWVLADGDVLYDARNVIRSAQGEIEKGYFWKTAVTVTKYNDIHVGADPTFPPDAIWTWATVYGGANWNASTHVIFNTVAPPPGAAVLTVMALPFNIFVGPGNDCLAALTAVPTTGQPGTIALNTSFHCTDTRVPVQCRVATLDSLSWDEMVHLATHEMGHSLGFGHPADPTAPGVNLISGTHSASDPNTPSYPSMMWGGLGSCYTGSGNVTLGLSTDDVASANAKYH